MDTVILQSVIKQFRRGPSLFHTFSSAKSHNVIALKDVSLTVDQGDILVLLGPNGSGKTTLLKLISTILLPDSGRILVGPYDTDKQGRQVRTRVGFAVTSERSFFPRLTARENLDLFGALEDIPRAQRPERVRRALRTMNLEDAQESLVATFSSGMYQRLGIARALLKNPSVLLLDEPSRSLDRDAATDFWKWLRTDGRLCTVVLATHNFEEAAAVGNRVAILHKGTLVSHHPVTPATTFDSMRDLYCNAVGSTSSCDQVLGKEG